MINHDMRIVPNRAEVSGKVLDGEAIIINVSTGNYFSMDGAGAVAWTLLDHGPTVSDLAGAIASHYGIPTDRALDDVSQLVETLLAENLIVSIEDGDAPGAATTDEHDLPERSDYQTPSLNKYTDMADLLALDPPMPMLAEIPATEAQKD